MKNGRYYSTNNETLYSFLNLIDSIFKNKENNFKLPKKKKLSILIVRIEHLGDVLSTLSILNGINQLSPESEVDLLISEHSKFLMDGLSTFNKVLSIPSTIFHDRTNKKLLKKMFSTIIAYLRAFKIIRNKKYDCVIFGSHHFFGMQLMGVFAKESLAYSSVGFSKIHSCETKIKYNFQIEDRARAFLENLFPEKKIINKLDLSYKKIKFQEEDININKKYAVLTLGTGNQKKDLSVLDIFSNNEIRLFLKDIAKIFLVGDLPITSSLDQIRKTLNCEVIYLAKNCSLNKLANLIYSANGIISADTFIAHLSIAISKKNQTFIFYKSKIGFDQWKPPGENVKQFLI